MDIANVADNTFDNSGSSELNLRVVTETKVVPITSTIPGPDTVDDGVVNTLVMETSGPVVIDDEIDEIFNVMDIASQAANIETVIPESVDSEIVNEVVSPQYQTQILPNAYEVLMPVEFWNGNIKNELEKYGLPPETQPTDFFNFLIVNREKLANPSVQNEEKEVNKELKDTAKLLESILKLKTEKPKLKIKTWWIVAAVVVIGGIVAAAFYFKKGLFTPPVPKNTSWI